MLFVTRNAFNPSCTPYGWGSGGVETFEDCSSTTPQPY